jgi:hypothetical protein
MRIQHLAAQLVRDQTTNVGLWHEADLLRSFANVCLSQQTGQHLLEASFSPSDPYRTSLHGL